MSAGQSAQFHMVMMRRRMMMVMVVNRIKMVMVVIVNSMIMSIIGVLVFYFVSLCITVFFWAIWEEVWCTV